MTHNRIRNRISDTLTCGKERGRSTHLPLLAPSNPAFPARVQAPSQQADRGGGNTGSTPRPHFTTACKMLPSLLHPRETAPCRTGNGSAPSPSLSDPTPPTHRHAVPRRGRSRRRTVQPADAVSRITNRPAPANPPQPFSATTGTSEADSCGPPHHPLFQLQQLGRLCLERAPRVRSGDPGRAYPSHHQAAPACPHVRDPEYLPRSLSIGEKNSQCRRLPQHRPIIWRAP